MNKIIKSFFCFSVITAVLVFSSSLRALELAPRLWSHLPSGINFGGLAYAYTEADIGVDPLLELNDVEMESHTWLMKYIHTFDWLGKSARIDLTQGYHEAEWNGLLQGSTAKATRNGPTDTFVRLSTSLYGAPPLEGKKFAQYRANQSDETIVGAGLVIRLPTGDYHNKRLLNIGANRYVVRPQLGVSHQQGAWIFEATTEASIYFNNDDFFDGKRLEQDPLYIVHAHAIYNFRPGLWMSASVGYDYGGETAVNGVSSDNKKRNTGWGLSGAYPLSRTLGVTLTYLNIRTEENTGVDSESVLASLAYMW